MLFRKNLHVYVALLLCLHTTGGVFPNDANYEQYWSRRLPFPRRISRHDRGELRAADVDAAHGHAPRRGVAHGRRGVWGLLHHGKLGQSSVRQHCAVRGQVLDVASQSTPLSIMPVKLHLVQHSCCL